MSAGLEQLVAAVQAEADERLALADADLARLYPGDPATRQPVHTVYVPANAFEQQTPWRWGPPRWSSWTTTSPTPPRSPGSPGWTRRSPTRSSRATGGCARSSTRSPGCPAGRRCRQGWS
ncbi:DUF6986 family protein [Serinicoccus sp. CNJ-927]|uniref:DUF6986 family protein n=1 Tax=Serinicoccus sp. CNJ-927 TaxID=1904970 RepID=UPI0039DFD97E